MSPFLADYLIFVFWATTGAIQVGASFGRFEGVLLVRHALAARAIGLALTAGAIAWFFLSEDRNINDIHGGLDAGLQGMGFFGGATVAVIATLGLTSLLNLRMRGSKPEASEGLEALRKTTYFEAVRRDLPTWWDGSPARLASFFSGDRQGPIFALAGRLAGRIRRRIADVR